MASLTVWSHAMYSVSHKEVATVGYFLELHEMVLLPSMMT